ncbi:hypothetical protein [Saccharothrix sp. NRRL B-16314]|uniref:hypothetical protein n=1 Tax=Saccharothrix sp. NRRL B-16314 TaxID=1463825 RepID=UPI000527CB68|nr:hypothetical protein [Saccharothrix sp. NRRL B-16314]
MTDDLLSTLTTQRRAEVLAALAAVETSLLPVPQSAFRALLEPASRQVVERLLTEAGRVLIRVGNGYLSAYDDTIAAQLARLGIGVLPRDERAILAMVLLLSVALPRAQGLVPKESPWENGHPVPRDLLVREGRLKYGTADSALRQLTKAELVRSVTGGIVPGRQFLRLTPAATDTLFDELILLAEPQGDLALSIRRLRAIRQEIPENPPT